MTLQFEKNLNLQFSLMFSIPTSQQKTFGILDRLDTELDYENIVTTSHTYVEG